MTKITIFRNQDQAFLGLTVLDMQGMQRKVKTLYVREFLHW